MEGIGEEINIVINNLAEKLGVAADKVYPLLVRQSYVDGFISLAWCIIAIGLIFGAVVLFKKSLAMFNGDEYLDVDEDVLAFMFISSLIGGVIACIIFGINLNISIKALLNPEYHAIMKIFDLIKQ